MERFSVYRLSLLFLIFLAIKILTWAFGYGMATQGYWELNKKSYLLEFHHLELDPRIYNQGKVDFYSLWRYADAEWYVSIAKTGYPKHKDIIQASQNKAANYRSTEKDVVQKYAFFPLFPAIVNVLSRTLDINESSAAFYVNLLSGIVAVFAFLFFFDQYFPDDTPILEAFTLLFIFPFSLFYSLYYAEILFLALSLLVFAFCKIHRYGLMCIAGILLCLTRPYGFLIIIPILYVLIRDTSRLRQKGWPYVLYAYTCSSIILLGVLPYLALCWKNTGRWDYYSRVVQFGWGGELTSVFHNLIQKFRIALLGFNELPVHGYNYSKIETIVLLFFAAVIIWMWFKRDFPRELTIWSTVIWAVVVAAGPRMSSFSRNMCISFPVFIFWALHTTRWVRLTTIIVFSIGYLIALKTVIQYEWLG